MHVTYRPLRDADYPQLARLLNDASVVDGRAQHQTADEIREEFTSPPVDLTNHTLAAWDGDHLIGALYAFYLPSDVREVRCYLFGTVQPDRRGNGIGRRLLEWGLNRGTELLRASGNDLPKYLRVDSSRTNTSSIRLFERFGLEPIRYFADLRVDLNQPAPATSSQPSPATRTTSGFRIVPWDLARNEEARAVKNEAFMDHWGS
ncbi:MAG: GNAT family N-acetyltransferase, partial [Ilumatobacteraceae bacterium]